MSNSHEEKLPQVPSTTRKCGHPGHASSGLRRQRGGAADISRDPGLQAGPVVWSTLPDLFLAFGGGTQTACPMSGTR